MSFFVVQTKISAFTRTLVVTGWDEDPTEENIVSKFRNVHKSIVIEGKKSAYVIFNTVTDALDTALAGSPDNLKLELPSR